VDAGIVDVVRMQAGVYEMASTLTLTRNVTIMADGIHGSVVLDGLGERRVMTINSGTVRLVGLNITRGTADSGGGVHVFNGYIMFDKCNIMDNEATGSYPDGGGGGVRVAGGTARFDGCSISGNTAVVRRLPSCTRHLISRWHAH
jgi:hypothetical protein